MANRFASLVWTFWLLRRAGRERPLSHFLSYFSLLATLTTLTPRTREEKAGGEEGRVVVRQGLVWQRVIEPELRSAYLPYWSDCRVVNPGKASVTRETCWFVVTSHPNRIRNVIPPCNCQTQHHYARSQQYQEHKIYGLQKQQ